jgi:hypothetical protein
MQNETADPFASFKASEAPNTVQAAPEKKKRGRGKAKGNNKTEPATVRPIMVPLSAIDACRNLTDEEIKFTVAVAGGIAELSKKAQQHVVAALARIFS